MEYRKLGKWGVKVSEVALGSWLTYGGSVRDDESAKHLQFAFSRGINFFDTANVYSHGRAEEIVGKAVREIGRDNVFLATKVFFAMGDGPNDRGLSRKHVFEQCHHSLRRMGTEYIDLYQCHRYDPDTPLEELVTTMHYLMQQGKILYWGVSEWSAEQIQNVCDVARALNAPPPVSNQPRYNLLQREIEADILPVSWKEGLGQVVFSPLAQGVLTGKYRPNQAPPPDSRAAAEQEGIFLRGRETMSTPTLQKVEKLTELARELGITTSQLALSWILRLQEVSSVIIGATKQQQIEENIAAAGMRLQADTVQRIDEILQPEWARR